MKTTNLAEMRGSRPAVIAAVAVLLLAMALQLGATKPAGAAEPPLTVDDASVSVEEGQTATNNGTYEDTNGYVVDVSASVGNVAKTGDSQGTWSWSYDAADGPADGQTVTITATRQDSGKSSESVRFPLTVANVAPSATLDAPASAEQNGSFAVSLDDATDPSQVDRDSLTYAFDCGSGYGEPTADSSASCDTGSVLGEKSIKGKVIDKDGGSTQYTATVAVVDTAAPDTTITSSPAKLVKSKVAGFGFASTEGGSSFECSLDGGTFEACSSPKDYANLASKAHDFRVRAIDPSGNADPTPAAYAWTVDALKPTIKMVSPKVKPKIKAVVKDNLTDLSKSNLKLYAGGKPVPAAKYAYNRKTDVLTYSVHGPSGGKKVVRVVATDAAKNVGAKSWSFNVKR